MRENERDRGWREIARKCENKREGPRDSLREREGPWMARDSEKEREGVEGPCDG